jgi:hypothetical protein
MSFENAPARGRNFIKNVVVLLWKQWAMLRLVLRWVCFMSHCPLAPATTDVAMLQVV